jgi:deoxyribonuclease-4
MRFGRHMPLGSKPTEMLERAQELGCDAAQIFVTNPRAWRVSTEVPAQARALREAAGRYGISPIVAHAAYLINLASPKPSIAEESIGLLRATLERADAYGCASVVFHIGSHAGAGEEAGVERLIEGIKVVLAGTPETVMLLLENDVGGGGKLGYRLENLATVLDRLPSYDQRLGVCLDTAHLWGAGFDIGSVPGVRQTLAKVEETITCLRVKVIHLNDTKEALGSHLDHHACIGDGVIGSAGLRSFLRHPGLAHATVLLETPWPEKADGKPDWVAERKNVMRAKRLCGLVVSKDADAK